MRVLISRINESKNDLILTEKEAWVSFIQNFHLTRKFSAYHISFHFSFPRFCFSFWKVACYFAENVIPPRRDC